MKRSTKERLLGLLIIIPVLIMLLTLSSCSNPEVQEITTKKVNELTLRYGTVGGTKTITTVIIDECEYLIFHVGGTLEAVVHKGNCYNSIHYDSPSNKP